MGKSPAAKAVAKKVLKAAKEAHKKAKKAHKAAKEAHKAAKKAHKAAKKAKKGSKKMGKADKKAVKKAKKGDCGACNAKFKQMGGCAAYNKGADPVHLVAKGCRTCAKEEAKKCVKKKENKGCKVCMKEFEKKGGCKAWHAGRKKKATLLIPSDCRRAVCSHEAHKVCKVSLKVAMQVFRELEAEASDTSDDQA